MDNKQKKTTAKLITDKSNIKYLSNFSGSAGFMLLTRTKSYLFTDSRYILRAKNTIKKDIEIVDTTRMWRNKKELSENWAKMLKKHKIKSLGVEENNLTVTKYKNFKKISNKVKFIDISGNIEQIREVKTKEEIKLITKSQRINEKVFLKVKEIINKYRNTTSSKKLREIDIAKKIIELGFEYGAEDISFDPIVGFGKNSAVVHHESGKTTLKKNDIILIDMGMKYKGYCSDMSRTILPEKPTKKQEEIYKIVLLAQNTAIKGIKADITGKKADNLARQVIVDAGYGEYYQHAGGHGVGLDIHEFPSLSEKYTKKLKENSIITIEPGIYIPGEFGVRIEDMLLVTTNSNKNLTKINKKL